MIFETVQPNWRSLTTRLVTTAFGLLLLVASGSWAQSSTSEL
jgi:hypothetical protein